MKPIIKMDAVKMGYNTSQMILNDISLEVYPGEIVGYIGPNGAGKSTTIKVLLGLFEYQEGDVEVCGQKVHKGNVDYKSKIGYVPESSALYESLTGREYLEFIGRMMGMSDDLIKLRGENMCQIFDIKKNLDERIGSYSKGMKQKLLITSSMIHNPEILIFDEPLNGLDANSVMIFKEILSSLASRGKTILYSSHIMDVVEKISDRIVLINKGQIVANGSFDELSKKENLGSLENVFNALTGFNEYSDLASKYVSAMVEEDAYVS